MFHCWGDEPVKREETGEKGEARTKDEAQEERERDGVQSCREGQLASCFHAMWGVEGTRCALLRAEDEESRQADHLHTSHRL